ncbi:MAG: hypothetical protein EB127_11855 [Alphaproteobacteria bacterium]|nr:hypothetical protein [Alphaproteobacteria bacterium]
MSGRTLKSALKSKSNLGKTVKVDLAANTVGETYPKFNRRGDKTRKLHLRSYKLPNARRNAYKDKILMHDMGGLTDEAFAVIEARENRLEMKRRKRFENAMTRHTSGPEADASVPPEPELPESEGGRRKRRRKTRRRRY